MTRRLRSGDLVANNFRIVAELGGGSMGLVFLATDCTLERDVALKVMHPALDIEPNAEHVQRFLREARTAAKLRGEHVVQVYEVGTTDDGLPYILMESLTGESLDQELARCGKLPVSQAVSYVLQACVGVSEAHARGIVHRDLKPANLFLHRPVRGRICLKVLDFGIAKLSFESVRLTLLDQMLGTPLYMSPEQRTSPSKVDARSDIWSLGVILYQAITGRVPFSAQSGAKLHDQILNAAPKSPSELVPELPNGLAAVLLKCLEKRPSDRYQDVGELAWALAPYDVEAGKRLATDVSNFLELEPATSEFSGHAPLPPRRLASSEPRSFEPTRDSDRQGKTSEPGSELEFSDADTLVQAVANRARDGRGIVFLLGSGLTAPQRGNPGVPNVEGMIRLVRDRYSARQREQFDELVSTARESRYQTAFARLLATHGVKEVNRTIRRAVLQARRREDSDATAALAGNRDACLRLERDIEGWHLTPGLEALGRLLSSPSPRACNLVLTSNFDPLIEVAVLGAKGRPFRTVLHGDGELRPLEEDGCHIVHFHGDWWRTDTLHTPASLAQDRPKLTSALSRLLRERTLVVLGYGGWDDVFTRSLVEVVRSGDLVGLGEDGLDVLWAFYSNDRAHIVREYGPLFAGLSDGIVRGRILFYKGANLHDALPAIEALVAREATPSSSRPATHSSPKFFTEQDGLTLLSAKDEPNELGESATHQRASATEFEADAETVERQK